MKVARQRPRNTKTTSITTRNVMMIVSRRVLIVLMMLSEESMTVSMWMSEGRSFSISASCFLTSRITLTVLAPVCFWIAIWAERTPPV